MIAGLIALTFAAAFAGAAIYVNWVEQPARLALDDEALLSEWGPSDSRAVALLLAFALAAAVGGFIAYFETQDVRYVFGALIAISSWPYAFVVMAPLNNQILALRGTDVGAARALVRQWGYIEVGFAAIGVLAVAMFLWISVNGGGPSLRRSRRDVADAVRFFTRLPVPAATGRGFRLQPARLGGAGRGRGHRARRRRGAWRGARAWPAPMGRGDACDRSPGRGQRRAS